LSDESDADALFFLLQSIRYLCLHGEAINYCLPEHKSVVEYCLKELMIPEYVLFFLGKMRKIKRKYTMQSTTS
jgi:hypothetical protein